MPQSVTSTGADGRDSSEILRNTIMPMSVNVTDVDSQNNDNEVGTFKMSQTMKHMDNDEFAQMIKNKVLHVLLNEPDEIDQIVQSIQKNPRLWNIVSLLNGFEDSKVVNKALNQYVTQLGLSGDSAVIVKTALLLAKK